jgi:hypothetical protein
MKIKQKRFQTRQQAEWAAFCDASSKAEQEAVVAQMTNADNVVQARRILYGPTAAQRQESEARQRAINDDKAVSKEVAFMMRDNGFLSNDGYE